MFLVLLIRSVGQGLLAGREKVFQCYTEYDGSVKTDQPRGQSLTISGYIVDSSDDSLSSCRPKVVCVQLPPRQIGKSF